MFYNPQKLFGTKMRIFAYTILILIAGSTWWYFTDIAIMLGNYGKIHTYIDVGLSVIMVFGFPLFILALSYKIMLFGNKENLHRKSIIGTIGGIIGTILSGSSCCGLTLASYFGLLPLMGFLPYSGLEIKVLGAIGLMYALYDIMKNLEVCRMKKK